MIQNTKYELTIGWLYPSLMSTYGDRGNIICLQKRCEWRNIQVEIVSIETDTSDEKLKSIDLLFGGGAQDREQDIVIKDLVKRKVIIKDLIENNVPSLFVCGAPQLMGKYYEPSEGKRIEGLGIFDMHSIHPGKDAKRLIGNTAAEIHTENLNIHNTKYMLHDTKVIVGFENHGGRTYLGEHAKPFAKVLKGNGNNGEDGTEGIVYKNAIGCYFHGPLLPKNPHVADFLIQKALEVKYKKEITLSTLDDTLEHEARKAIATRLGITL